LKYPLPLRISAIILGTYVVFLAITFLLLTKASKNLIDRDLEQHGNTLASTFAAVAAPAVNEKDYDSLNVLAENAIRQAEIAGLLIQSTSGVQIVSKGICTPSHAIHEFKSNIFQYTMNQPAKIMATLHLFINKKLISTNIQTVKTQLLAAILLLFLFCFLGAIWLINRQLFKPLSSLTKEAKKLSEGNFNIQLTYESMPDELAELAISMEQLAKLLKKQVQKRIDLEQDLVQQKKLTMLGELSSMLLHEVGSSISRLSMIQYQLKNQELDQEGVKALEELEQELNNLNRFAKNISLFSKKRELKIKPIDLKDLLKGITASFRLMLKKDVKIMLNIPETPVLIKGDADTLQRALANIIRNAVDACPDKGGKVSISLAGRGGTITIVIKDNGTGISAEHLDKIFEPFFSTKGSSGTGLGLAIAKSFIEAHGGKIDVASSQSGTTFNITLPSIEVSQ